jgi:hypothetical protein
MDQQPLRLLQGQLVQARQQALLVLAQRLVQLALAQQQVLWWTLQDRQLFLPPCCSQTKPELKLTPKE